MFQILRSYADDWYADAVADVPSKSASNHMEELILDSFFTFFSTVDNFSSIKTGKKVWLNEFLDAGKLLME